MIVECNVWCVGNSLTNIDLGLPEGDKWTAFAVDFSKVEAIKLASESDFLGDDKPVIYFHGDNFTLDIPFEKAVKLWKEALNK